MFDLIFIVGITVVGIAATAWLLRRDATDDDPCGGCTCKHKDLLTGMRDVKKTE